MEHFEKKQHWNTIYQRKKSNEVSWFQRTPETSLEFLREFDLPHSSKIIDIGGGDSLLVDHLLDLGYESITVLDISEAAVEKAKDRLGIRSEKVKWIVADVTDFKTDENYDFWHDRATFHFLTDEKEIEKYIDKVRQYIREDGILLIGTFSEEGPAKCSGLEIKQYSEASMTSRLKKCFSKIKCITVDHKTPFDSIQNFIFCSFRKVQYN